MVLSLLDETVRVQFVGNKHLNLKWWCVYLCMWVFVSCLDVDVMLGSFVKLVAPCTSRLGAGMRYR